MEKKSMYPNVYSMMRLINLTNPQLDLPKHEYIISNVSHQFK